MTQYNLATKMTNEELQRQAPQIYNLAVKLDPFLEEFGLLGHTANVALAIDASGSMEFDNCKFFTRGKVQTLVERMLPFAVRFDDNAEIDAWLFSNHVSQMHAITPANVEGCVDRMDWKRFLSGTDYCKMIDEVIRHYGRTTPREYPVYLIFVTDGAPSGSKATVINKVAELASLGIFTQFVALGEDWPVGDDLTPNQTFATQPAAPAKSRGLLGSIMDMFTGDDSSSSPSGPMPKTSGMRFLVELDEEIDVEIDSANAFAVKDPATVSEDRLYRLMTREYPLWLPQATAGKLIK